jgi:imidazolonepropionase
MAGQAEAKPKADLVLAGASQVLTCAPGGHDPYGAQPGAWVAIQGERILAVAQPQELEQQVDTRGAQVVRVDGKVLAPGFVDAHTHLVFGGSRAAEYAARLTHSAAEVRAMGIPSGIQATMRMTRQASLDELVEAARERLGQMLRHGTTTAESKSGYGLSLEGELRLLQANHRLRETQPVDIVSTFLGAHDFPPDLGREEYVDLVVEEMIPRVAEAGLAQFCDVYCDEGYYTLDETRRILQAGLEAGLKPKIHLDAYASTGAAELAVELGAVSVDHLNYTQPGEMRRLAGAGVSGVVMPGLDFAVKHPRPFDARAMLEAGMELALATDLCPACYLVSMQGVMQLACRVYGLSPQQALWAATMGAARAVGLEQDRGSLEAGKLADIQAWDLPSLDDVVYRLGNNAVCMVVKRGRVHTW